VNPAKIKVTTGQRHTCGINSYGEVWCWGQNNFGQVGDNTTTRADTPKRVVNLPSGITWISAGRDHTCAIDSYNSLYCWGSNNSGQLGIGVTGGNATSAKLVERTWLQISAGNDTTCGLRTDGAGAGCWGECGAGQCGFGQVVNTNKPLYAVYNLGTSAVTQVSTGGDHSCALLTTGGMRCWGYNGYYQLGDGVAGSTVFPTTPTGLNSGVQSISAGGNHTCVVMNSGEIRCWGRNDGGQVGDGTFSTYRTAPTPVKNLGSGSGVVALSAGWPFNCVLRMSGHAVQCWGNNGYGAVGDGTFDDRTSPVNATGLASGILHLSTNFNNHSCIVNNHGDVRCWGQNTHSQLGIGPGPDQPESVLVQDFP